MLGGTKARTTLQCETLEGRDVPAAQVYQFGAYLLVTGDANANAVAITDLGNGRLFVVADGQASVRNNVRQVVVITGGGDDTISYDVVGGTSANATGVSRVAISAGAGSDEISFDGGALNRSFSLFVNAGVGDDDITANLSGVALNNNVILRLAGSLGNDAIAVNSTGKIDGTLDVITNGGVGSDSLNGNVNVALGSLGNLSYQMFGSSGDDNFDVSLTGAGLNTLASTTALVHGGIGFDTAITTPNVTRVSIEANG